MLDQRTIQSFLLSKNPAWGMIKSAFIAFLIWQIMKKYTKQSMSGLPVFYKKVLKKGNKIIWHDELSNTYAVEDGNDITPFDTLDKAKSNM